MVEKIAAVVGENVVLASEVEEKAGPLMADISKVTDPDKRAARASSLRREVLDRLIDDELILQQAAELKLTVTSEQIDSSIEEIKKQNNIDDDQLREALRGAGDVDGHLPRRPEAPAAALSRAQHRGRLARQRLRRGGEGVLRAPHEGQRQRAGAREPHLHRHPRRRRPWRSPPRSRRRRRRSSSARRPRTSPSSRASCPTTPPPGRRAATSVSSARTCCRSRSRSWCSR